MGERKGKTTLKFNINNFAVGSSGLFKHNGRNVEHDAAFIKTYTRITCTHRQLPFLNWLDSSLLRNHKTIGRNEDLMTLSLKSIVQRQAYKE